MLRPTRHGPSTLRRSFRRPAAAPKPWPMAVRCISANAAILTAEGELAEKLHKMGLWGVSRAKNSRKKGGHPIVDPRRVNVVSEELCDEIIKYTGPSLERHRGCDLIDLNPGSGLWSSKLNEFLEPRRHVMMEPDADIYKPFLQKLIDKDSVKMIPESGYLWKSLLEMLRTSLPDQKQPAQGSLPQRNDTLVITANLSMYPKKKFGGFSSVSTMILYQFLAGIPTRTLFHRYGLVRMLLWVNDDEQRRILPRSLNRRRRSAFETELSCEWVREVAGPDIDGLDTNNLRDEWLDAESGYNTLRAMQQAGMAMPAGRETRRYLELMADQSLMGERLAGRRMPILRRPFVQELEKLQNGGPVKRGEKLESRLKQLQARDKASQGHYATYLALIQQREAALDLWREHNGPDPEGRFFDMDREFNERFDNMKKNQQNEFRILWDGLHIFRQDPPLLHWDRRAYEPLVTRPTDFFPNAPTALMDVQPKQMHPLLLQYGPGSSRSGDMASVMLRSWYQHTLLDFPQAMHSLWSGFGDLAAEHCPSTRDLASGGSPMTGEGTLPVRAMNEKQWTEVVAAWMAWPFRPTYEQLLGRMLEEPHDDEEVGASGPSDD